MISETERRSVRHLIGEFSEYLAPMDMKHIERMIQQHNFKEAAERLARLTGHCEDVMKAQDKLNGGDNG